MHSCVCTSNKSWSEMAKWLVYEENQYWVIKLGGRTRALKASENARNLWLKKNCAAGDKVFYEEPDGHRLDITRKILK